MNSEESHRYNKLLNARSALDKLQKRGLSIRQIAELVPCDGSHLSRVSNGEKFPSQQIVDRLQQLAEEPNSPERLLEQAFTETVTKLVTSVMQAASSAYLNRTNLSISKGENWSTRGHASDIHVNNYTCDHEVPTATIQLRRIGWIDGQGRVYQDFPAEATAEVGSLTALLIDPGCE